MPLIGDVPTIAEQGVPGFESGTWQGVLVANGTPAGVVQQLNAELIRVIRSPDVRARLAGQGAEVVTMTPAEQDQFFVAERKRWAEVVAQANIKLINPCHSHFRQRVEEVKRGVWQAGGFPVEMPAISLSEPFQKPTTMLYRNLLAMETRGTAAVLPGRRLRADGRLRQDHAGARHGRDLDEPAHHLHARGPDAARRLPRRVPGLAARDTWKYWAELRAGNITEEDWQDVEDGIARSPGHCMTMGTASTMTSAAEALGLTLPGAASIPAPDSRHAQMATLTGKRIVEMVWEDLKPSRHPRRQHRFDNAVTTVLALGGSTNAIVHLIAMARRAGVALDLDRFDALARKTPVLANVRPGGKYLMEDFYYAGGLRALLSRLGDLLDCSR